MSKSAKRKLKEEQTKCESIPPTPRVGPSLTLEQHLKRILTQSLGGPCGDPDVHHCLAGAHAFLALRQLGSKIDGEESIEEDLRNSIYNIDFIALAETGTPL